MGPRAGLDRCGKSRPTGIRSPDSPARSESLYGLHHPCSTVAVLMLNKPAVRKVVLAAGGTVHTVIVRCDYLLLSILVFLSPS